MSNALAEYRASLTPEQIAANLASAAVARAKAKEVREANKLTLKMEYLDSNHWSDLATKHKVRMPLSGLPTTPALISKYLKRCDVPIEVWDEHYTSRKFFVKWNPRWSAQATVGLILELKEGLEVA